MSLMGSCEVYVAYILVGVTLWVYAAYKLKLSMNFLMMAMFFPAVLALWFTEKPLQEFFHQIIGSDKITADVGYSVVGTLCALGIITTCAVLSYLLGWGTLDEGAIVDDQVSVGAFAMWFITAAGEEIGWRCYLLPCLVARYQIPTAFMISGIVWGLWHVPLMLWVIDQTKPPKPRLCVAAQCLSCVLNAFPHGWLAVKSGYSLWGPTFMHATWNLATPIILGSIYTQDNGWMRGPQWLINSEGVAGCLVMLPMTVYLMTDLT